MKENGEPWKMRLDPLELWLWIEFGDGRNIFDARGPVANKMTVDRRLKDLVEPDGRVPVGGAEGGLGEHGGLGDQGVGFGEQGGLIEQGILG